ncbi:unnamed protein product [Larinioides sclopetarius]|uniref:Uncharacterized protein n=1 Tax=Larinioides sclopetarius TaxID=280406 RepID=A0AAV2BPE3_9ARAC
MRQRGDPPPLPRPGRTVPGGADVTALRSPPPSFPVTSHRTPSHIYKGAENRESSVRSRIPLSQYGDHRQQGTRAGMEKFQFLPRFLLPFLPPAQLVVLRFATGAS